MKRVNSLIFIITLSSYFNSCAPEQNVSNNGEVELIETFLEDVQKHETSEDLLNKYFLPLTEIQRENGALEFRTNLLNELPSMLEGKSYRVVLFNENYKDRLKLMEGVNSSEIFVIIIEG